MDSYHLQWIFPTNERNYCIRIDALESACWKIVHKVAEATREFIGNTIADKIVKPRHIIDENPRNV